MNECNDGLTALRGDDILSDSHKMQGLTASFDGLRHVDVHLVTVEVSIKGSADTFIETQCLSSRYLDLEAHHADTMQTGLSVENNDISVPQMPLHYVAHSQLDLSLCWINRDLFS